MAPRNHQETRIQSLCFAVLSMYLSPCRLWPGLRRLHHRATVIRTAKRPQDLSSQIIDLSQPRSYISTWSLIYQKTVTRPWWSKREAGKCMLCIRSIDWQMKSELYYRWRKRTSDWGKQLNIFASFDNLLILHICILSTVMMGLHWQVTTRTWDKISPNCQISGRNMVAVEV